MTRFQKRQEIEPGDLHISLSCLLHPQSSEHCPEIKKNLFKKAYEGIVGLNIKIVVLCFHYSLENTSIGKIPLF